MTTNGYLLAAAVIVVWLLCAVAAVAIFHTDAANDEAWEAERPGPRPVADPEWLRDLADDGLGPIFEAGYQRQAKRLAAELDDATAVNRWLGRSS